MNLFRRRNQLETGMNGYFKPRDLNELAAKKSTVSVLHMNIQSTRGKEAAFDEFLNEFRFNFTAIMITETWLHDHESFVVNNYQSFHLNRTDRRGGGSWFINT